MMRARAPAKGKGIADPAKDQSFRILRIGNQAMTSNTDSRRWSIRELVAVRDMTRRALERRQWVPSVARDAIKRISKAPIGSIVVGHALPGDYDTRRTV